MKGVEPVLTRDIAGGGSFLSTCAQEVHLGMSGESFSEVVLVWPDGHIDSWRNVTAGYYIAIQGGRLFRVSQTTDDEPDLFGISPSS